MQSIFERQRQKSKLNLVIRSSGMISLGIMMLMVCIWILVEAKFDTVSAQVKINQENIFTITEDPSIKLPDEPIEDTVPNKVEIKDLGIKLSVLPQISENGEVKVSESKANYLVGSGVIGEKQNIVIFAHKRRGMFVNLVNIKIGTRIILNSNDRIGEYEVVSAYETRDNDMTVVSPDNFYGVTLYTCNRWDDSHRFVVKAKEVRTYANEDRK